MPRHKSQGDTSWIKSRCLEDLEDLEAMIGYMQCAASISLQMVWAGFLRYVLNVRMSQCLSVSIYRTIHHHILAYYMHIQVWNEKICMRFIWMVAQAIWKSDVVYTVQTPSPECVPRTSRKVDYIKLSCHGHHDSNISKFWVFCRLWFSRSKHVHVQPQDCMAAHRDLSVTCHFSEPWHAIILDQFIELFQTFPN